MRPASGVFQKRQHTLSARVLGCTKNGGFGKLPYLPPKVIATRIFIHHRYTVCRLPRVSESKPGLYHGPTA